MSRRNPYIGTWRASVFIIPGVDGAVAATMIMAVLMLKSMLAVYGCGLLCVASVVMRQRGINSTILLRTIRHRLTVGVGRERPGISSLRRRRIFSS